jgi:ABC-type sugar transport system, periplasmic component
MKVNMKVKSKKRSLLLLAVVCAVSLVLQGCVSGESSGRSETGGGEAAGQPVELVFSTHWVGEDGKAGVVQKIVDDFNAQHEGKAKVRIDSIPDDDIYQDKMKTNLATDSLPDIFTFYYNPVESQRYYSSGKLLDLKPYMNDSWAQNMNEDVLSIGRFDDQLLAIPLDQMITPIFYNKSLFEAAGIDTFPQTWDDMIEAAEALKQNGVYAFAMGTGENAWSAMLLYSYIVSSIGGPDVMRNGLDDPAYVQAAELLRQLFAYAPKDAIGATYQQYASHYLNEKAAMIVNGPWMISEFMEKGGEALAAKMGVGTSPAAQNGKGKQGALISGVGWTMAAKKQEDEKRAEYAAKFIEFFTHPGNAKQIFLESGEIFESTNYSIEDGDPIDPISQEILKKLNEAPQTFDYFEGMTSSAVKIEFPAALSGLVLGEYTPEQFVDMLKKANSE